MTIDELERAAAAFQFVGGLSLWSARVYVARDDGIANLWLQFLIPDSTDPTGKTTQCCARARRSSPIACKDEERSPEQYIVDFLTPVLPARNVRVDPLPRRPRVRPARRWCLSPGRAVR
jgi:hypothetical protein